MGKRLKEYNLYDIYCNWIRDAEVFRCFFRSMNFVSLKHYPDFELGKVQLAKNSGHDALLRIVDRYDMKESLLIFDLPGKLSIETGFYLQKERNLKAILIFNGILHPFGLIGDQEYISRLIGYGEELHRFEAEGFALVLDSERFAEYTEDELRKSFNNQYELGEDDLPSAEMLMELGYKSVVYIYDKELKEDLETYLTYLSEANLLIHKENVQGEVTDG